MWDRRKEGGRHTERELVELHSSVASELETNEESSRKLSGIYSELYDRFKETR